MDLGLATAIITGVGVHMVYGKKGDAAAMSAILTGIALYAAYYYKLKANPKINGYMMGGNKNGNGNVYGWKPLVENDIQYVRNLIDNNSGMNIVSEP